MVSPQEWEQRKSFVNFTNADCEILGELHLVARAYADTVLDELYDRWLAQPVLRKMFRDSEHLTKVKHFQREYFVSLTRGEYGPSYLANRLRIGQVHKRVGLTPRWYMGAYATYLEIVLPRVIAAFEFDRAKQRRAVTALTKIIALDQELALTAYFET